MFGMSDSVPLYLDDSYLREFDAAVVRSGPRFVVLDATAFYPEGGGQPSDTGTLQAGGETRRVLKAMRRGDQIFHYLDGDLPEGARVHGAVEWDRRFTHMRLHSAEHLLTGLFEAEGSGPKVFSSFSQLDFQPSIIDEATLKRVWERFDSIVEEDAPVTVYYTSREELDVGDDARKRSFLERIPPNIQTLRMVKIGNNALTFCVGTHVRSTAEIGRLNSMRLEAKKKQRMIVYFELDNVK
jgi:misacylated tRNA(Ala) deacylase